MKEAALEYKAHGYNLGCGCLGTYGRTKECACVYATHCAEVCFKLVCPTASGTECGMEAGEVFVSTHLQEGRELLGWEANEVQIAPAAPQSKVWQF